MHRDLKANILLIFAVMLKKTRAWLRLLGTICALAFYLSRLIVLNVLFGQTDDRGFRFRRKFIIAAMRIMGIRLRVEGDIPDGQYLYVANHRSMFDPVILLRDIPAFIVSKAEVSKYPLIGRGARETGVIYVERNKKSSRAAALEAIMEALENERSILIYPEGTTSSLPATREFRIGSFRVAAQLEIPVVPVAVDYRDENDYWSDGRLLDIVMRMLSRRRTEAMIRVGSPVTGRDANELMDASRSWINEQIPDMHRLLNLDSKRFQDHKKEISL